MRRRPAATPIRPISSRGLRAIGDFEISVSAYPEKHPESKSFEQDIDVLKRKIDAGATRAITQFFFDNDLYFRFLDRVRAAGIAIPIVPGVTAVQNFKQTANFAKKAGASVPDWLAERFEGLDDDPADPPPDRGGGGGRTGVRPARSRRRAVPFLHHEPRRSGLCGLPSAGRAGLRP